MELSEARVFIEHPSTVVVFRIQKLEHFFHRPPTGIFLFAHLEQGCSGLPDHVDLMRWHVTCDFVNLLSPTVKALGFQPSPQLFALASPPVKLKLLMLTADFLKMIHEWVIPGTAIWAPWPLSGFGKCSLVLGTQSEVFAISQHTPRGRSAYSPGF